MRGCDHCAATKAKQNDINKKSDHIIKIKSGQRLHVVTETVKTPKMFDIKIHTPN